MYEVLRSVGLDVQVYLDIGLLGHEFTPVRTDMVRGLLELGANPDWVAPNGKGVLEHAIVRYMNGEALHRIAPRLPVRKVLCITAGMGDVDTLLLEFVNESGVPNAAARADRPDTNTLNVMRHMARAQRPSATDREITWEAFMRASLNSRYDAMDVLLRRGFPIDYAPIGTNALCLSVQHQLTGTVAFLMSRGADLHYQAWPTVTTCLFASPALAWMTTQTDRVSLKFMQC